MERRLGVVEEKVGNVEKMEKMGKSRVGDEKIREVEGRMGEFEDKIKQL